MEAIPFIDIHRHRKEKSTDIVVYNQLDHFDSFEPDLLISAGIHPWYIHPKKTDFELQQLESAAAQQRIIAIGECGLDRLAETPLPDQIVIFKHQIVLSEKYRLPIIVHCVKAFPELLLLKKNSGNTQPWILHGFNNKVEIARQCIQEACYLSFGKSVFNENSASAEILKGIPADRFFLETDNGDHPIADIYQQAAVLRNCTTQELAEQVYHNFKTVFNYERH